MYLLFPTFFLGIEKRVEESESKKDIRLSISDIKATDKKIFRFLLEECRKVLLLQSDINPKK